MTPAVCPQDVPAGRDYLSATPLAHGQRGIWLHQQQAPESAFYNTGAGLRVTGRLNIQALAASLTELARRHEVLRSVDVSPALIDASGWDEPRLRREVIESHCAPYDLEAGPLFRAGVFSLSENDHAVLLGAHHLVIDAGSWLVLLEELTALYSAFATGKDPNLPPAATAFSQFVRQEAAVVAANAQQRKAFWKERLADVPPVLDLPLDFPRPSQQRDRGGSEFFTLEAELTGALESLATQEGVSLYSVLLAGFQLLLYRYSQQDRFAIGIPASGRPQPEFARTVGNFVDVLPFIANLRDDLTVRQLLRRTWQSLIHGLRRAYPFALIVEELKLSRNPSVPQLVQTLFSFPEAPPELAAFLLPAPDCEVECRGLDWNGSLVKPYTLPQQDGWFDLGLEMVAGPTKLLGVFKFNRDLFEGETIRNMAAQFRALLHNMVSSPDRRAALVPALSEAGRARILAGWSQGEDRSVDSDPVHVLFQQQAARTPASCAVSDGIEPLTYADLNARSNRLARELIRRGVGRDKLIAICMQRSPALVVAILAVLKSGAGYLPLDPTYPRPRLETMLMDAGPILALVDSSTAGRLPVDISEIDAALVSREEPMELGENLEIPVDASDLAYCIYTSGSTGKPKGVLVEHRGIPNLVRSQIDEFGLHPGSRVLQFASFSFDAFVSELFTTLIAGAELHIVAGKNKPTGEDLHSELHRRAITCVTLPPTVLATLPPYQFETLVVAGEACPPALARQWIPLCGRFVNAYGPTEATVCVTMARSPETTGNVVPIGRPIANAAAYILDPELQPCARGIPGELYAGGPGIARGYLNASALTQEKFVANPFDSTGRAARLYRTGDRCRYLSDGRIEFLGRLDDQVKLRGFRIELGEIENLLASQDGVRGAAAVVREDQPGDRRLVAYYCAGPDRDSMWEVLARELPDHMLPAALVQLDSLPLTQSGKVDRGALPKPSFEGSQPFTAPRNDLESAVVEAFEHVLQIPRAGIHDSFFRLGGDSILSISVVSRLARQGHSVRVSDLFANPTPAGLAAVLGSHPGINSTASQLPQTGDAPFLPIQNWFLQLTGAGIRRFNQSVLLKVKRPVEVEKWQTAIKSLIAHHDALRFRYSNENGAWRQTYGEGSPAAFEYADLRLDDDATAARKFKAIQERAQDSLQPEVGDLVRFVAIETRSSRWLFACIHHLAVDGVSWRILVDDLTALLEGRLLQSKTSSYRDWGERLRSAAQAGQFDSALTQWASCTDGDGLPLDDPSVSNTFGESYSLSLKLSPDDTRYMLRVAPDLHQVTPDSLLVTALTDTLADWGGAQALEIRFEHHGRVELSAEVDMARTAGWFTSSYPQSIPRFSGSALRKTRYTYNELKRIVDGGISYGALRDFHPDPAVRERLGSTPAPQVVHNYLGEFDNLETALFQLEEGGFGFSAAPELRRDTVIDCNAIVLKGRLEVDWTVSPQIRVSTARALFAAFERNLVGLIDEIRQSMEVVRVPADYPEADLTIRQVEHLQDGEEAASIEAVCSLTPMQSGMLFHSRMSPESGAYVEQSVFGVDGPFDTTRFIAAVQTVIDRHEALRASFPGLPGGEVVQVIHGNVMARVTTVDLSGLTTDAYGRAFESSRQAARRDGFNLSRGPLIRLMVVSRPDRGHDVALTFHHALMDLWSVDLFWNEVVRIYAGERLPAAPSYRAFIRHLRGRRTDKTFWQGYLSGFQAPTALPGITRTAVEPGPPAIVGTKLTRQESARLNAFARERGVTVGAVLQAGWAILLARYAGESDVVFGMVTSGRASAVSGIESMVGLLINTLPLRVSFTGGLTGDQLLDQITRTIASLQAHEHTPLVEVQSYSEVPAKAGLFRTLFLVQNSPGRDFARGSLRLQQRPVEAGDTLYPLVALAFPGEEASFTLMYDSALYERETIERLTLHWRQLVLALATDSKLPALELPMAAGGEAEQVQQWSTANRELGADLGPPLTIHAMFERQVQLRPNAVAVSFEDRWLCFSDLNRRANRLAHHLIHSGVKPGEPVVVCMDRSPEMIVALLAVLKAGGAYVPVDPGYPKQRIDWIAGSSGARIVLSEVDSIRESWPDTNPAVAVTPDDLAYVIYTSGSTGEPKGVLIAHRNVWHLLAATDRWFGFGPGDVWALFHNFTFDVSVWEMWGALCLGGCLEIVPPAVSRDSVLLFRLLCERNITVLNITPSALAPLIAAAREEATRSRPRNHCLHWVIVAGEALDFETLRPWFALYGDQAPRIVNMYGPTETTIYVTYRPIEAADLERHKGRSRIGGPVPNVDLRILDSSLRPAAVGVPGELYIGGAALGRGYLNRPELTAERFLLHPEFGRLYKTGDLCRWLEDGDIEYIGRADFQVKLRGFRIELGEIESALLAEPEVQEAAAIVREDQAGEKRIVAYFAGSADAGLLRERLSQRLPEYMVPSAIVHMDALPLTSHRKLDRRALPPPDYSSAMTAFVGPRNEIEAELANIWKEVLGLERIGVHDNFFALGGHSLSATRVAAHVRDRMGSELSVRAVFETSSLAKLAEAIHLPEGRMEVLLPHEEDEEF